MATLVRHFKLDRDFEGAGLSCGPEGLSLAGVPLLSRTATGFEARSVEDLEALTKAAYGQSLDTRRLRHGLQVSADALNRGDIGLAMIAAVHLRLPELSPSAAAQLAKVADDLAKYNADQPRDWHGRWTSGENGGPPEAASIYGHPSHPGDGSQNDPWGGAKSREERVLGPAHQTAVDDEPPGIGDNGPPAEREPDDDLTGAERVPKGWDLPGFTADGAYHPPVRVPILPDGTPWPLATHDLVRAVLTNLRGGKPVMTLYVPNDGVGPTLVGSTDRIEYEEPPGYSTVKLSGLPQSTWSRGTETNHARDSIDEALTMAAENRYSEIVFNRALATTTQGLDPSPLRPDVVGVLRPEFRTDFTYDPYESYSPGQKPRERQRQLEGLPGLGPVRGQQYKMLKYLLSLLLKLRH